MQYITNFLDVGFRRQEDQIAMAKICRTRFSHYLRPADGWEKRKDKG